ncbi:MAG: site-2 protease family protein [Armatimonadetes bacterium]|nr:site-2 protease family protein [Armatimonadota bacterium]
MKWSWKIGKIAGIDIFVHATFFLIFAWVILAYYLQGKSAVATVLGLIFVSALFACIVFHELGHALTARRFGIKTRDITLLPIGGVARLERMPDEPVQELWVALAGPAVNVVIAAVLFAVLKATHTLVPTNGLTMTNGPFLERLALVNVFLVLFNLIPAFPMDGGRVLRAVLATRMEYSQATAAAASVGQMIALGFGFLGLMAGNPFLIFIAFFVWIGAAEEASMVQMKTALGGIPVSRAMVTEFHVLNPADKLGQAVERILAGSQHDFPVLYGDEVIGILMREDLVAALQQRGPESLVQDSMRREFQQVEASEMLETAFRRLQDCNCRTLPVKKAGALVGLLTADNLGEFVMIQSALQTVPPTGRPSQTP